jgi:hypothetical protein
MSPETNPIPVNNNKTAVETPAQEAAAASAAQQAAIAALVQKMEVSGIRVHNTGAFVMSFSIGFPESPSSPNTESFAVGDSRTISMALTPDCFKTVGGAVWATGTQIWPIAHITDGSSNHSAGQNVIFNAAAPGVAIYNCGGTCDIPSFSFQEISTDEGSNPTHHGGGPSGPNYSDPASEGAVGIAEGILEGLAGG